MDIDAEQLGIPDTDYSATCAVLGSGLGITQARPLMARSRRRTRQSQQGGAEQQRLPADGPCIASGAQQSTLHELWSALVYICDPSSCRGSCVHEP